MLHYKHHFLSVAGSIVLGVVMLTTTLSYANVTVNAKDNVQLSEDSRLMAFFEKTWNNQLNSYPEFKTSLGIKDEDYGKWNDRSDAHAIKIYERDKADLAYLLKNFNYEILSVQKKISYDFYKQLLASSIEDHPYRFHNYALEQEGGQIAELFVFLQNRHKVDNLKDAQYLLERLSGLSAVIDQYRVNSKIRADKGIIVPAFSFPSMISGINSLTEGQPIKNSKDENALYQNIKEKITKLDISESIKQTLLTEVNVSLKTDIAPAIEQLINELKRQQKLQKHSYGAWALPDGKAYYEQSIKHHTTLNLKAEDLHRIGISEVTRIHNEMRTIMKAVKFEGTLQDFFTFMEKNPANYYPNIEAGRDAFLHDTKEQTNLVLAIANKYFNRLPKADFDVKRVEPWREKSSGIAFYNEPSMDGSRPGIYYANLKDMNKVQKFPFVSIAYHEGVPGHHFQIALAQEIKGVPNFQKFAGNTAYIEGWELYSEFLAKEMGFFKNPLENFGRLQEELWRAIRLVVDTGIHAKKWSREQAIEYAFTNSPYDEADVIQEIERFMVWPGQAVSYKVGMMKIQELRQKSKNSLGEKFNIRDFHSIILEDGAVPLALLEKQIEAYIQSKL